MATAIPTDIERDPITWLLRLEMARRKADAPRIAVARARLAELGIRVAYDRPLIQRQPTAGRHRKVVADAR